MDKSSTTVVIPATIDGAIGALEGIDALLTAKGWERAAIVFAFTYDTGGGRPRSDEKSSLTISDFANLSIAGLTTRDTVRHYRNAWIDGGGDLFISPGDEVELPTIGFPPNPDANFGKRVSPNVATNTVRGWSPEAKAEAIKILVDDPDITDEVVHEIAEKAEKRLPGLPATPTQPRTLGAESVITEVGSKFGAAYDRIEDAVDLIEDAIKNGVRFDNELEYPALVNQPEFLTPIITRYLKTVAMAQTEEGAIK